MSWKRAYGAMYCLVMISPKRFTYWKTPFKEIFNQCFPLIKVKVSSRDPPYMSPSVKHLCTVRNRNIKRYGVVKADLQAFTTPRSSKNEEENTATAENRKPLHIWLPTEAEPHIRLPRYRAPVAQLVEHRDIVREVVSSTPVGPTLRVLKITE